MTVPARNGSESDLNQSTGASNSILLENPRAFCVAAGTWFSIIGVVMCTLGCCAGVLFAYAEVPLPKPPPQWLDYLKGENRPMGFRMVFQILLFLGGLLFTAIGIGLRSERKSSATLALVITPIFAFANSSACYLLWQADRYGWSVLAALVALTCVFLFFAATGCHATFRQFPPPKDQYSVTNAQLEEMRNQRRRRYE